MLIVNIFCPGFGTTITGCIDKKGCNWSAFCLGILQGLLTSFVIGWLWGIFHMYKVWEHSKESHSEGGEKDDHYHGS